MRERTKRERRTARACDDSWPPLEKLSDRHPTMCGVACAHGVFILSKCSYFEVT